MKSLPKVSVIIPVRQMNHFIFESMSYLQELEYRNFEIIIFPNKKNSHYSWKHTRIIPTGSIGPAEKRDLSIKYAQGELLAFIDDDAYPSPGWLTHAVYHFDDPSIVAVGGPGVTPPNTSFREQLSGWVSASPVGAGPYAYRFLPGKPRFVEDYPSMNLIVRKADFAAIGGFDSDYYPGEDTKLCLDLINSGKKIYYEPKAIVYHHRRPLWLPHLRQNGNFGIHRGFFARVLPRTSAKPVYFLPSILVLTLILLQILVALSSHLAIFPAIVLTAYILALLANAIWISIYSNNVLLGITSISAVGVTHVWYGMRFLQGFFLTKHLHQ